MTTEPTDLEKIRWLPWLIWGDVLNNAFVVLTFDGPVYLLFLNELGLDNTQIGLLLSLIPFCGIVAPFIAPLVAGWGFKRVFVTFWGIRKFVIALLLFTPLFLDRFGTEWAFAWVAGIIFCFAMCRAIAETGGYPWRQEAVPHTIRGKFTAIYSITTTLSGIVALGIASYIIDIGAGLSRFMLLLGTGVIIGLLAVWSYSVVPGGAPLSNNGPRVEHWRSMWQAGRDRDFLFFLLVLGLVTVGSTAILSFVPLFMAKQVGLTPGQVVLLTIGTYIGALLTSYLWGWSADRYGSKPVMQSSLFMMLALPIFWFLMPRGSQWSAPLAMGIAFLAGVATLAWQISWTRYLFVNAIPIQKKTAYMAVYYAWFGLVSGCAPLLAGKLLDASGEIRAHFLLFTIDSYTPLFAFSCIFLLAGMLTASYLPSDGATPLRRFVSLFTHGNPVKALRSLAQYNLAKDELALVLTTEQMGDAKNPLSVQELLEALHDPSFNVRYEAINSIGRMPPDSKLVEALLTVLDGAESELCIVATRSLGKLGDKRAIGPLRRMLSAGFPLLQANSARALATLGDTASIPTLLEKLRRESNPGLQIAYASALGKLRATEATGDIFTLLRQTQAEVSRGELALAIARLAGEERYFIQHWRLLRTDSGTAAAQAVLALQKLGRGSASASFITLAETCAQHFAQGDSAQATGLLQRMLGQLSTPDLPDILTCILQECALSLAEFGDTRSEFVLLTLHTLNIVLRQFH